MKALFTRTRVTSHRRYARHKGVLLLLILVVALVLGGLVFVGLRGFGVLRLASMSRPVEKSHILALWESRDWDEVLSAANRSLEAKPMDPFYLGFLGLASYYRAIELPDSNERDSGVDAAIAALRKTLSITDHRGGRLPRAELEYALGRAYNLKGPAYTDLVIFYLEDSLAQGYTAADTREYLALAYAELGDWKKATENFEAALAKKRNELLLVAAARAYREFGEPGKAETLLLEAVSVSTDVLSRVKARLLLSEMYLERKDSIAAEAQLNLLLEADPESAEAHYRLGLIYQERNDPVRARAEWRKAVAIDPMHAASRQKLAEKL